MQKDMPDLPYKGLTSGEVAERAAAGQTNQQPRTVGKTSWQILASNLFTLFNLLNLVLAIALISVGAWRNLLFMGVVVSNTLIGTIQELRAKRTIDKLQLLAAPTVQVIRDGQVVPVSMEEVVLDDLFILSTGDQLCTDATVISGEGALNESLLTGESEPVDKRPGAPLLSGSYVTEGKLYARATKVGADSYASQLLAKARQIKQPHSELMKSMQWIVRTVGAAILPLGIIQLCKQLFILERALDDSVVSTVAAMLGMIPEGLMLLTSMALAVGVVRLGQRKTLVQDLYAIESLARVDTLCVDKTGTITKGDMEVTGLEMLDATEESAICRQLGHLVGALDDNNATFAALRSKFATSDVVRPASIIPFSSARKWSAACFASEGTLAIGAAEFLLGDSISPALAERIAYHSERGNRVLLLCHSPQAISEKALPDTPTPKALVLLSDVLREDAADTLAFFAREDVQIKVISGDNPLTVASVAAKAGLSGEAVDATTLDTPEKLAAAASQYTIFGRVTPEQKKDLVTALKEQGHTVGMMGDGVNDIPALKASDCAIAMAGGSDAARRVSQLTLLDANFSAVPHIVMEGRRVINNITRAASLFLVKTTFSFLLSLLLIILSMSYPFAPIQMTLISSLTVGIPSFFLALEPNKARVKGNFLFNVLRNALPGGFTVVSLILVIMLLSGPLQMTGDELSTLCVYTTGFVCLLVLLLTCLPLNFARGSLVVLMGIAFALLSTLFASVFYLVPLRPALMILYLCLIAAGVPGIYLMRKFSRWVMNRKAIANLEANSMP